MVNTHKPKYWWTNVVEAKEACDRTREACTKAWKRATSWTRRSQNKLCSEEHNSSSKNWKQPMEKSYKIVQSEIGRTISQIRAIQTVFSKHKWWRERETVGIKYSNVINYDDVIGTIAVGKTTKQDGIPLEAVEHLLIYHSEGSLTKLRRGPFPKDWTEGRLLLIAKHGSWLNGKFILLL